MHKKLRLTDENWSWGSYRPGDYKEDVLYSFYRYKDFSAAFHTDTGKVTVSDRLMEQMLQDGLIDSAVKIKYEKQIEEFFTPLCRLDDVPIEQIYWNIQQIRKSVAGVEAIEKEQVLKSQRKCTFFTGGGIDFSGKKIELLHNCKAVLMVLCETELTCLLQEDICKAKEEKKEVYLLFRSERGYDILGRKLLNDLCEGQGDIHFIEQEETSGSFLSGIVWNKQLHEWICKEKAVLFVYGEEGLLQCRDLQIDAIVHSVPSGFYTWMLTNQPGEYRGCIVYVPKHFDIAEWVKMTEKTRLSYWQLAKLWEACGDIIYTYTPQELYRNYPQYFMNIYENGLNCPEAKMEYPIRIFWPEGQKAENLDQFMKQYDCMRDIAVKAYLNSYEDLNYYSAYFDETLEEKEIPWNCKEQQTGIMVQGICVRKAEKAEVIKCAEGMTLRRMFETEVRQRKVEPALALVSNFLFFLTPRLVRLYNRLREDRPEEQVSFTKGHLDYMLCYRDGKRIETFPLFRKACIAMKNDGTFLFFNYRLGGGRMKVSGYPIGWKRTDVDVQWKPGNAENPSICIYTPYDSSTDGTADRECYRKLVGEGRFNLVIVQEQIICARKGSVILPAIGIVVSLEIEAGETFIKSTGVKSLRNGYYDCNGLDLEVELETPDGISEEEWKQVEWAYGGGLSLILDGTEFCEGESAETWFEKEGWMSPLSRQTQESALHKMAKHPRTAIGTTANGELVILVFSGRTRLSAGADYVEMCAIARKLFPDIRNLMNVDGGGSAMLGMVQNGSFMELSCPASSPDNCVGMVRPINTVLYLEIRK